jgi:hypothetical protein
MKVETLYFFQITGHDIMIGISFVLRIVQDNRYENKFVQSYAGRNV